jgi:predicted nucleic acid-binding protein
MKVVYDTCIYIDFLRAGRHHDLFMSREHIRYLSPVVVMELLAGARGPSSRKYLDRLFQPYSKAQRMITLHSNHYYKTGECIARLKAKRGEVGVGLSHDILIAISALSVGATLFTSNRKDFSKIQEYIPFRAHYL